MELFLPFQASGQQNYFTKSFLFLLRSSKLIFKTGNGIIKTGNGIISPTSGPLIKKLLLLHLFQINQGVQNWFSKQGMELSKQEMELFIPFPCLWSKNLFYNIYSILINKFKIGFQNRKWNYPNRKCNYFSHFRASDQKNSFFKMFHIFSEEFKIDFQTRKKNDLNRKWIYFSNFQASD